MEFPMKKEAFVVTQEICANRRKIPLGSIGFFVEGKTNRGCIVDLKMRPVVALMSSHIKSLTQHQASLLLAIESPLKRYNLVCNEQLFASICYLQIHDVVRLRYDRMVTVGIVKSFWKQRRKLGSGDLKIVLIEVELLDPGVFAFGNNHSKLKIDASKIITVSSSVTNSLWHREFHESSYGTEHLADDGLEAAWEREILQKMEGVMKGIQGHCNSCYLDTTLYSLFSFSSALDDVLFSAEVHDITAQQTLREQIVQPLRHQAWGNQEKKVGKCLAAFQQAPYEIIIYRRVDTEDNPELFLLLLPEEVVTATSLHSFKQRYGFVGAENVMNLRKLLRCDSFITEEKDPEEFLNVLLGDVLAVEPLLRIRSDNEVLGYNCYQIFAEKDDAIKVPTVQQLLEKSLLSYGLKFDEVPSCLILQMPRFGRDFKKFSLVYPSLELDLTNLVDQDHQVCCVCGNQTASRCLRCHLDRLLHPKLHVKHVKVFKSISKALSHQIRRKNSSEELELNTCSTKQHELPLDLFAVLCIESSHYVAFVRYGPLADSWLFFDSMAGTFQHEKGISVPVVKACPQIGHYLAMTPEEFAAVDTKQMDVLSRRFFCDAYTFLYQKPKHSFYRRHLRS